MVTIHADPPFYCASLSQLYDRPIAWVVTSEIFPLNVRGRKIFVCTFSSKLEYQYCPYTNRHCSVPDNRCQLDWKLCPRHYHTSTVGFPATNIWDLLHLLLATGSCLSLCPPKSTGNQGGPTSTSLAMLLLSVWAYLWLQQLGLDPRLFAWTLSPTS